MTALPDNFHMARIDDIPWEPHVMGNSIRKVLDRDPANDSYVHYRFVPPGGGNPQVRRLHLSISETFFFLSGSLSSLEFDTPEDETGRIVEFSGGTLMDRIPYSVHGTGPDLDSETGSTFLMWTSGGGEFEADPAESIQIPFSGPKPTFEQPFTKPFIVDSNALPWEAHSANLGWKRRLIAATDAVTPRPISLVFIPPNWRREGDGRLDDKPHRCFVFVLSGALTFQSEGQPVRAAKDTYVRWSPGERPYVTESSPVGATVLCVGHGLALVQ